MGRAQGKISRPDEIKATKISLGRQTHTDAHGHKKSSRLKDRRWTIGKVSPPHRRRIKSEKIRSQRAEVGRRKRDD